MASTTAADMRDVRQEFGDALSDSRGRALITIVQDDRGGVLVALSLHEVAQATQVTAPA